MKSLIFAVGLCWVIILCIQLTQHDAVFAVIYTMLWLVATLIGTAVGIFVAKRLY